VGLRPKARDHEVPPEESVGLRPRARDRKVPLEESVGVRVLAPRIRVWPRAA